MPLKNFVLHRYPKECLGENCLACEKFLPGFIVDHNGYLIVSQWYYDKYKKRIGKAVDVCPKDCLDLRTAAGSKQ